MLIGCLIDDREMTVLHPTTVLLRLASVADRLWPVVHLLLQCHLYVITCTGDGYIWPGRNRPPRTRTCLHWASLGTDSQPSCSFFVCVLCKRNDFTAGMHFYDSIFENQTVLGFDQVYGLMEHCQSEYAKPIQGGCLPFFVVQPVGVLRNLAACVCQILLRVLD